MGTMLLTLGAGLFFGLIVFFTCEEKSLKDADFSDMKGLFTQELKATECIGQFQTIRYMLIYFISLVIFDLMIIHFVYVPNELFALKEVALAYTFIPSLLGSWVILLVKWTYQPVIKLASSFMYGSVFIAASVIAYVLSYLIIG
ncbi:hypothetical protein GJV85_10800 [Sulfurimonas aquatica]|uniref:Uncharacterized protein n=1 Tax=Sulfurimonas aquatica TaxID=2672570 RepID=A0A975GDD8_9BACT|nr:hypothetical protein [Sulfurimonas aquatica]QSZ42575.1 hypothetical protein GJV85_10800 [Sulfurimonas aquatica]